MDEKVSRLKHFFWLLSGSNIELLKDCPTEHNRHANIGLAIFTTTLLAFFTGCLAGFEFGGKEIFVAIVFGILWATLVFTIDRTMVLTLKKDPSKSKWERNKSLIIPTLYRIFLSALISFFISIPLELWVFRENIELQMQIDQDNIKIEKNLRSKDVYRTEEIKNEISQGTSNSLHIDSLLNQEKPPSSFGNYGNKEKKLANITKKYNKLLKKIKSKTSERKTIWSTVPVYYSSEDIYRTNPIQNENSPQYKNWVKLWNETKEKRSDKGTLIIERDEQKSDIDTLIAELDEISTDYFNGISKRKTESDRLIKKYKKELENNQDSIKAESDRLAELIENQDGFTTKWVALNNIENGWVLFFIWFIRVFFFVVEMLPTMSKIMTPIGSYDRAVYRVERKSIRDEKQESKKKKEIEKVEFNSRKITRKNKLNNERWALKDEKRKRKRQEEMEEIEFNSHKITIKNKLEKERKSQEKILEKLIEEQEKISKKSIELWTQKQVEKLDTELDNFLKNEDLSESEKLL